MTVSYPKHHLHNQYRNSHRRASSAEIRKLHPGQDNLEVMHSFTSSSLKPHEHSACDEMSPGDTGDRDDTLQEATSEVPFAYDVCPYLGYPHPSITVQELKTNKFWKKSRNTAPVQDDFALLFPAHLLSAGLSFSHAGRNTSSPPSFLSTGYDVVSALRKQSPRPTWPTLHALC